MHVHYLGPSSLYVDPSLARSQASWYPHMDGQGMASVPTSASSPMYSIWETQVLGSARALYSLYRLLAPRVYAS